MSASTLVGSSRSSFLRWANILGNSTLNRWYRVSVGAKSTLNEQTKSGEFEGREIWRELYSQKVRLEKSMLQQKLIVVR